MADEYQVSTLTRDTHPHEKTISLDPSRKRRVQDIVIANASGRELTPGTLVQKIPVNTFDGQVAKADGIAADATVIDLKENSGVLVDGSIIRIGDELMKVSDYTYAENTFEGKVDDNSLASDATTINLTGNTGTLAADSYIKIGSEYLKVTAYDDTANTLTVERGAWDSTAAEHAQNDDITVVSFGTLTVERGVWGSTAATHSAGDKITVESIGETATQKYKPWDGLQPIEGYVNENVDATSEDQNTYLVFDDDVDKDNMSADNDDIPIPTGFDPNSLLNFVEVE